MRPKVVITILLLSLAGLLVILFTRPSRDKSQSASPHGQTASPAISVRETEASRRGDKRTAQASISQTDPTFAAETHEDYVTRRVAELMDLAMSDDHGSLYSILSELSNGDPQIREAAVTAAVQFKSPDAIPALQDALARTDDPEEKIRLAKAIDFLAIPSEAQTAGQTSN
jgi:HEAT repeats